MILHIPLTMRIVKFCRVALCAWKSWNANRIVRECESLIDYAKYEVSKAERAYAIALEEATDAKVALEKARGAV